MSTIVLRASVGRPLTNDEVDSNFINLNQDKLEASAIGVTIQGYDADLKAIADLTGTSGVLKKTAANTWALDTNTYLTNNQTISLSGDVSGSGTTSIAVTLSTVSPSKGGTGRTSLTTNSLLIGNGTGAVNFVAPGTSGNLLISDGTSWIPQIPNGIRIDNSINVYNASDKSSVDNLSPAGLYLWIGSLNDPRLISNKSISIKTPYSIDASYQLVLPANSGQPGQLLSTRGSGYLSWVDRPTRSKSFFYSSF